MPRTTSRRASEAIRDSLASAITMAALASGFFAIVLASQGDIGRSILCIMFAAILDACDGRVARATGSQSRFGAELDSLSDVVCFGAAPAFVLHQWLAGSLGVAGYLPSIALLTACAFRLARFNATSLEPKPAAWMDGYFTGIPAPAGAFVSLLPIYADFAFADFTETAKLLALAAVPFTAALMASRIPTFSGKHLSRKLLRRWFVASLAVSCLIVLGILYQPWLTFTLGVLAYLVTLPMSRARYKVLSARQV